MATFSDKIRLLFEVDDKGSFGKLKRDIADAEGATGKMRAGAGGLVTMLKENMAGAALAAGTALVTMGVKAVGAFQDSALAAGKFADATGLAVEDASRWIEVAGDLGIEAGTIQGAFQKLNKSIADGKPALAEYGVEVVKAKDGVVDANATFINAATTIGAIEDPTLRAKAAQELFGKSYGEVAELLEMSAGDVRKALNGVSDAKVIDEKELEKARKFRESMDNLKDKLEELALTVGEDLVPQLISLADQAVRVAEVGVKVGGAFAETSQKLYGVDVTAQNLEQTLFDLAPAIEQAGLNFDDTFMAVTSGEMSIEDLNDALKVNIDITDKAANKAEYYGDNVEKATSATEDFEAAVKALNDELSDEESWLNLQDKLTQYREDMHDASLSNNEKRLSLINTKQALLDYLASLEGVPVEKQTEVLALIDQGSLDEAERVLEYLARQRQVPINPVTGGQAVNVSTGINGRRAHGGPVEAGGTYLVGEQGPELLQMGDSRGNVVPNHKLNGVSSGDTYVFNQIGMTTDQLVRLVEQAKRKHGRTFLQ